MALVSWSNLSVVLVAFLISSVPVFATSITAFVSASASVSALRRTTTQSSAVTAATSLANGMTSSPVTAALASAMTSSTVEAASSPAIAVASPIVKVSTVSTYSVASVAFVSAVPVSSSVVSLHNSQAVETTSYSATKMAQMSSSVIETSSADIRSSQVKPTSTFSQSQATSSAVVPLSIYIEMVLEMSWKSFCPLRTEFRHRLSGNLYSKSGNGNLNQKRIKFVDVDENKVYDCIKGRLQEYPAKVIFYISKTLNDSEPDIDDTKRAADLLITMIENGQTVKMGPAFEGRINEVKILGKEAKATKKLTDLEKILVAVASTIGGIFLIVLLIWAIGRCRKKPADDQEVQKVCKADYFDIEDGSAAPITGKDNAAFVGDNVKDANAVKSENEVSGIPPTKKGEVTTSVELNGSTQLKTDGKNEEIEMSPSSPPPPPPGSLPPEYAQDVGGNEDEDSADTGL